MVKIITSIFSCISRQKNEANESRLGSRGLISDFCGGLVNASSRVGGASDLRCKTPRLRQSALEETRYRDDSPPRLINSWFFLWFNWNFTGTPQTESPTWRTRCYPTASKTAEETEVVSGRWAAFLPRQQGIRIFPKSLMKFTQRRVVLLCEYYKDHSFV